MNKIESINWIRKVCGNGWLPLIESVYKQLPPDVTIISVYQKWGALRFDTDVENEIFQKYLEKIEQNSLTICEVCGESGTEYTVNNWIHTLCKHHFDSKVFFEK